MSDEPTIWKFPVPVGVYVLIEMPENSAPLAVQYQDERMMLWARVYPSRPKRMRAFHIYGTGTPIRCRHAARDMYIGTVQLHGLVWHIHECSDPHPASDD